MKSRHILAALLTLSMVALASIGSVAATDYFPTLMNNMKGKKNTIWYFETYDITNGPFSGLTVNAATIVATWWDDQGVIYTVTPYEIVLAEDYVELYFYKKDLPKSAVGNSVTGLLTTGGTFLASGPGWVWSNVH